MMMMMMTGEFMHNIHQCYSMLGNLNFANNINSQPDVPSNNLQLAMLCQTTLARDSLITDSPQPTFCHQNAILCNNHNGLGTIASRQLTSGWIFFKVKSS